MWYVFVFCVRLQDLFKHSTDAAYSVTDIPYFEGDFWPNIIEETIKELDQEAKEREAEASCDVSNCLLWCALFRVVCSN